MNNYSYVIIENGFVNNLFFAMLEKDQLRQ